MIEEIYLLAHLVWMSTLIAAEGSAVSAIGAKRQREEGAEASSKTSKKQTGSSASAATASAGSVPTATQHVLKKSATVLQRVVFALRQLGSASSHLAVIKACAAHCEYDNAKLIRKTIKTGLASGALQVSERSSAKVWVGGEVEPAPEEQIDVSIQDESRGAGPAVKSGDIVAIDYELFLAPETSASAATEMPAMTTAGLARVEKGKSFSFTQGAGDVIKGMDRGVLGMCLGGKRTVLVPWQLGYGKRGSGPDVPPCSDLLFKITLVCLN